MKKLAFAFASASIMLIVACRDHAVDSKHRQQGPVRNSRVLQG